LAVHGDFHPLANASTGIVLRLVGADTLPALHLIDPSRRVVQHPLGALIAGVAVLVAGVLDRCGGGMMGGAAGSEHEEQRKKETHEGPPMACKGQRNAAT